jgi:3',5'-cyclic AMP phosphodiesterase CpdA
MNQEGKGLITRRQAIISLSTIAAAAMARPASVFCSPVKDKLRFAVIGDWGTGDRHALGTASRMYSAHQRSALDFVISAGDNIYPNGAGRYLGRNFEQPFSSLIKDRISFYTVLGNHDVDEGRQDQCTYPLFNMCGNNYYKIEKGDGLVDFFMLDSTDFTQTQAAWLDSSLSASNARWKVAVFHHPIYSSGKRHGSALGLRKQLEPMFTRYGVRAVFSGHDHIYERTRPQQGIQYFVTGAGGKVRSGDVDRNSPFTETTFDKDNHFMLVEVDDKQISFQAISETGATVDSGTIAQA